MKWWLLIKKKPLLRWLFIQWIFYFKTLGLWWPYLVPGLVNKWAAFLQVWSYVSVWDVQDLECLVHQSVRERVRDSVSHIEHMRHLTGDKERVLEQITPQHWLVLQRAALSRQPYWWHDSMWIWLKGSRVEGDGWQAERDEKQVEKERLIGLKKILSTSRFNTVWHRATTQTCCQRVAAPVDWLTLFYIHVMRKKSQVLKAVHFSLYLFNLLAFWMWLNESHTFSTK